MAYTGMRHLVVERFLTFKIIVLGSRVWEGIVQRYFRNKMVPPPYSVDCPNQLARVLPGWRCLSVVLRPSASVEFPSVYD